MGNIKWQDCRIRLVGDFQTANAAVALAASFILEWQTGIRMTEAGTRAGLSRAFWPGRFQVLKRKKFHYVVDGPHNGDSMKALFRNVRRLFPGQRTMTIFGTSRDKKLEAMLPVIRKYSACLLVTKARHPRAQDQRVIMEHAEGAGPRSLLMMPTVHVKDAILVAESLARRGMVVVITGSLFLVGEALKELKSGG